MNLSKPFTFSAYLEVISYHLNDNVEINVTAEYEPPTRGSRDSFGAPIEPDDEGGISIQEITLLSGQAVTIEELAWLCGYDNAKWLQAEILTELADNLDY
jgi:hypothetical protein